VIFRIAYAYEQWTRHRRPPPGFGPLKESGIALSEIMNSARTLVISTVASAE
jgi:hypothetical protein